MTEAQRRKAAAEFASRWEGKGYEKGESQMYWLTLLRDVLGVECPEDLIVFEDQVKLDHTSFIDGRIPSTAVLIEQKSLDKDLMAPIRQSDGTFLTPFRQAKRYSAEIPYSQRPRWIVVCNFREFHIYDMERPDGEPEIVLLANLPSQFHRLDFLVRKGSSSVVSQTEVSVKAGGLVGKLYNLLLNNYAEPHEDNVLRELNKLCVRLVFCLYAEDTDLFGQRNAFHDYLAPYRERPADVRRAIIDLFDTLNTPYAERDPYLDPDLAAFPYVNGGLFAGKVQVPFLTKEFIDELLDNASMGCDWSHISPTIFGSVFESTLNPETRHSGGMHYTSIENIHRVIDPLFLDGLREDLEKAKTEKTPAVRRRKLKEFRDRLARITILDPACGSGNFLTESYISLRRLENEALRAEGERHTELNLGEDFSPVSVSLRQFYGIEINDFAVAVAQTALWIAENQMMQETADIVGVSLDILPLKNYHNIVEANALTIDWKDVVDPGSLTYIIGNPPFLGAMMMSKRQRSELISVWGDIRGVGELDYVSGWYKKAYDLISDSGIRCAFVSTNSICQGQQAVTLWKPLSQLIRTFAYRTFIWDSQSNAKAHVHCVIVGFTRGSYNGPRYIFDGDKVIHATNISPYLNDAPDVFIDSRSTPLWPVPPMAFGSMPRDGGNFIITDEERRSFISQQPLADSWIKKYVGAREFINSTYRWCLWLVGVSPAAIRQSPMTMQRVEDVRKFRLDSKADATRKFADTPTLFCQIAQPDSDYLLVPAVSSEKRTYIPIGFMDKDIIASNLVQIIPGAGLYHFGVLTSSIHMAWMRTVAGRLESRYRYSKDIVYNNFPWPDADDRQRAEIERAAQAVLDARGLYPDSSLADLYDPLTMPPELRKAHRACDRSVARAYGFSDAMTEADIVGALIKMYINKTNEQRYE